MRTQSPDHQFFFLLLLLLFFYSPSSLSHLPKAKSSFFNPRFFAFAAATVVTTTPSPEGSDAQRRCYSRPVNARFGPDHGWQPIIMIVAANRTGLVRKPANSGEITGLGRRWPEIDHGSGCETHRPKWENPELGWSDLILHQIFTPQISNYL